MTALRFRLRAVEEELEADLTPASGTSSTASGKAERKRYASGEERFKLKARDLPVSDGTRMEVFVAGTVVATVAAERSRIDIDLESPGAAVPAAAPDDELELRGGGRVLLRGTFRTE